MAVVELLLEYPKIDISNTDETRKSAWLYARDNSLFLIMQMLENRVASKWTAEKYTRGSSPSEYAVYRSLIP